MEGRFYSLRTRWKINAPITKVWDAIVDVPGWPRWWRGVSGIKVRRLGSEPHGVGTSIQCSWRSYLPYSLTFVFMAVKVEPGKLLEFSAVGDLEGLGRWEFKEEGGCTVVEIDWEVKTTKSWMNLVEPIARPIFIWSHDGLMKRGQAGLRAFVGSHDLESACPAQESVPTSNS